MLYPFPDIDRMMEDFWKVGDLSRNGIRAPAVDMFREDGNLKIEMDMPGVDKEDIIVRLIDNSLCVSARKKEVKEERKEDFYRSERAWRAYGRTIKLPTRVHKEKVTAEYRNGTLHVKAPIKGEEREKQSGQEIEVR
jgi:HSP20 family protein